MTKLSRPVVWPVLIIGVSAFIAIFSGWYELGQLAHFGVFTIDLFDGNNFSFDTSLALPFSMEAYAAWAIYVWAHPGTTPALKKAAGRSAVIALVFGAIGQVTYHTLVILKITSTEQLVWLGPFVGILPVVVVGLASPLVHQILARPEEKSAPPKTETQPVDEQKASPEKTAQKLSVALDIVPQQTSVASVVRLPARPIAVDSKLSKRSQERVIELLPRARALELPRISGEKIRSSLGINAQVATEIARILRREEEVAVDDQNQVG